MWQLGPATIYLEQEKFEVKKMKKTMNTKELPWATIWNKKYYEGEDCGYEKAKDKRKQS